tara:strand:+ start:2160 stop:3989 length:1830 start_codon:yes stop_codon:yes gene_type:complete
MAEKIVLDVAIETGGSQRTLGQLEKEAELLNEELRKVPLGTKAFKDLQTQLVGVNKQIKNTELSMEALDNEQVASELGSVAGAVGDVTAAFVLLGGTGGALEETAQNIEKALGISMAFKGAIEGVSSARKLFNNILKQSNVLQKVNNTSTVLATGIMKLFGGSVNTTSVAFKGLRTAIIATGIGALAVGVGLLIANFDKLKAAINGVSLEQKKLIADAQKDVELSQEKLDAISRQENILKLQGKTEREILNIKLKGVEAVLISQEKELEHQQNIKQAQIESETRNKEILTGLIAFVTAPFTLVLASIDELTKQLVRLGLLEEQTDLAMGFAGGLAGLVFDPVATEEQANATIEELKKGIENSKNELAGFKLSIKALDEKEAEDQKKLQDEDKKRRKELEKIKIRGNEETNLKLVEQQKTLNQRLLELYGEDALAYEQQQEAKRQAQLESQNATFDLAQTGVNALLQLNEAFTGESEAQQKKAFERRKKLEIAGALISSAQGVVNIIANKSAVPTPFDIPFKAAQIGFLLATTVAQISKIKQQQFSGSGSTGGGVPNLNGTGGGAVPGLSPVTNTSTLVPQEPTKVFVTETDITNTQNKVNVIEDQATIQ